MDVYVRMYVRVYVCMYVITWGAQQSEASAGDGHSRGLLTQPRTCVCMYVCM